MAITQLLLRADREAVVAAASSGAALDALTGPPRGPTEEMIDLDWSVASIEEALRILGLEDVAAAVASACEGDGLVSPEHPEGAEYRVYSEIRWNDAARVQELSVRLGGIPAVLPVPPGNRLAAGCVGDFSEYLGKHARQLAAFYTRAAAASQVVVTWSD